MSTKNEVQTLLVILQDIIKITPLVPLSCGDGVSKEKIRSHSAMTIHQRLKSIGV